MKFWVCLWFWVTLICVFSPEGFADSLGARSINTGGDKIVDSVYVKLDKPQSICINEKVTLRCPPEYLDRDVLDYRWVDSVTGQTYNTRDIVVKPRQTTVYSLEIVYVKTDMELIQNGDFEMGNRYFDTEYYLAPGIDNMALRDPRRYKITDNAQRYHRGFVNMKDHSGQGNMMVSNGDSDFNRKVWGQRVDNINAGQQYAFSAWAATVSSGDQPRLRFAINNIPLSNEFRPPYLAGWQRFYYVWSGDASEAYISLVDLATRESGNDFAIDDISFAPVVKGFGVTKVEVLPQLELNEFGATCELDGFPRIYGSGISDYEWHKLGTDWFSNVQVPDVGGLKGNIVGKYYCKVKGYCGEIQDTFDILPRMTILDFADSVTLCRNSTTFLNVSAEGTKLTYEWRLAGKIVGQEASLKVTNKWDATYECRVGSLCGDTTLFVFVGEEARWLKVPKDTVICAGSDIEWEIKTSRDGAKVTWTLPDGSTYIGSKLTPTIAGVYRYKAEGCGGSVKTGKVTLTVHPLPTVLNLGKDSVFVCPHERFQIKSNVTDQWLKYKWTKSGRFYASSEAILVDDVVGSDTGWYALRVTDVCGNVQKDSVYLGFYADVTVKSEQNKVACPGDLVSFTISSTGKVVNYLWDRGGAAGKTLNLINVNYPDTGYYRCTLTGVCGDKILVTNHLAMLQLPKIIHMSPDTLLLEGARHHIEVEATGDSLVYSWKKEDVAYHGDEYFLDFEQIGYTDSGRYEVTVGNRCTSQKASSLVRTKWKLEKDRQYLEMCEGVDTVFNVLVKDKTGLSFRWYHHAVLLGENTQGKWMFPAVTPADSGAYRCEIRGRGWSDTTYYRLTVWDSLKVVDFREAGTVCEGQSAEFSVSARGKEVTYAWSAPGSGWQVVSDSVYWKNKIAKSDGGIYRCELESRCGDQILTGNLVVENLLEIWEEPADTVVCIGEKIHWKIEANPADAIVRWWFPNGQAYSGKELKFEKVRREDAGTYRYRVEGTCDTTEIKSVILDIHPFPGVLDFGQDSIIVCTHDVFHLTVPFTDPWLTYSWTKEGVFLSSDDTLEIRNVTGIDTGWYELKMTDACGIAQQDKIHVGVHEKMSVISDTMNVALCLGESVTFEVKTSGKIVSMVWDRGTPVGGNTLSVSDVNYPDSGYYRCTVTGICGDIIVIPNHIQVLQAPRLVQMTPDTLLLEGVSYRIKAEATGDSLTYQWKKEGEMITGDLSYLAFNRITNLDSGRYEVIIKNRCAEITAASHIATKWELNGGDWREQNIQLCRGTDTILRAKTGEESGLVFKWYRNDIWMNHHTLSSFALPSVSLADTGTYRCEVSGRAWADTSYYRVSVWDSLQITDFRYAGVVCEGTAAEFVVSAKGKDLTYTWSGTGKGWSVVEDSIYRKNIAVLSDIGTYRCELKSFCGNKILEANLDIENLIEIIQKPLDTVVCVGVRFRTGVTANRPDAPVRWWFPDGSSVSGKELIFETVRREDAGVYRYRVEGLCDTTELDSFRLGVHPFPGELKFAEDSSVVCVQSAFEVPPPFTDPGLTYLWTKSGAFFSSDAGIHIDAVTKADTGWYNLKMTDACRIIQEDQFYLGLHRELLVRPLDSSVIACYADTVDYTVEAVGDGLTYSWNRGDMTGNVLSFEGIQVQDSGIYRCVVKDICAAAQTAVCHIRVLLAPQVESMTADAEVVEGRGHEIVAVITGDDPVYSWAKDDVELEKSENKIAFSPVKLTDRGRYRIKAENRCGSDTAASVLTVLRKVYFPQEIQNRNVEVCEGTDTLMVCPAFNALGYRWYAPDGQLLATTTDSLYWKIMRLTDAGKYTCVAYGAGDNNEDTCYIHMEVLKGLEVLFSTDTLTICEGGRGQLGVKAIGTEIIYHWSGVGSNWLVQRDTTYVKEMVDAGDAGDYFCRLESRCGDSLVKAVVIPLPGLKVDEYRAEQTICPGDTLRMSVRASGIGVSYLWDKEGKLLIGRDSVWQMDGVKKEDAGIYHCQVNSACGNKVLPWTWGVWDSPEIHLNIPEMLGWCKDSLTLSDISPKGGTVRVNGVETDVIVIDRNVLNYNVDYQYTDPSTGCRASAKQLVKLADAPYIRLADDTLIGSCHPYAIPVEQMSDGQIRWEGSGKKLSVTDPVHPVYTPSEEDGNRVWFRGILTDRYECEASDSISLDIAPFPYVRLSDDTLVGFCTEVTLHGEFGGTEVTGMKWYPAKGVTVTGTHDAILTGRVAGDNLRWAIVTDRYGCEGRDTVKVTVIEPPFIGDKEFCSGTSYSMDCSEYAGFVWEDGFENPVRTLDSVGYYHLSVSDRFGCSAEAHFIIHPRPSFVLRDTFIFEYQSIRFAPDVKDEGFAPYDIVWWDGRHAPESVEVGDEGNYTVKITDNIGCTTSDTVYLEVKKRYIAAPDAFLPGTSKENSKFYLKEVNFVQSFEMYIYNRWGELVFKTNVIGMDGGWDGSFKGSDCPTGAYLWVAMSEGKVLGRGTVMLIK